MITVVFLIGVIIFGVVVLAAVGYLGKRVVPNKLNQEYYQSKWSELLTRVKTNDGMSLAVIDADKLLDDALKKRHFRGKTMGERLVAAQRTLSDNDAVWYAHKLRNRLVHEQNVRLKKRDVQKALAGFRQALRDLGAL
jgi:hypothetical protein